MRASSGVQTRATAHWAFSGSIVTMLAMAWGEPLPAGDVVEGLLGVNF